MRIKDIRPLVGVGVIVTHNKKVLVLKRKNSHGNGSWAFIGGHLEFGETLEQCAKREVLEEAGIKIKDIKFPAFTNDIFTKEKKHYITIFVVAKYFKGKLKNMEPEKSSEIKWVKWDELPKPLFVPIRNLLKQKFNPFN